MRSMLRYERSPARMWPVTLALLTALLLGCLAGAVSAATVRATPPGTVRATSPAAPASTTSVPEQPRDIRPENLSERGAKYKYIIESMGFKLVEMVMDPDDEGKIEMRFEGRLTGTDKEVRMLREKYPDEEKLLGLLERMYVFDKNSFENFEPYRLVLSLTRPVRVKVYFRNKSIP